MNEQNTWNEILELDIATTEDIYTISNEYRVQIEEVLVPFIIPNPTANVLLSMIKYTSKNKAKLFFEYSNNKLPHATLIVFFVTTIFVSINNNYVYEYRLQGKEWDEWA